MRDGHIDEQRAGTAERDVLRPPWPGTGVVVGVDDSLSVLGAVAWAAAEAHRRRLPLHLVQVLAPPAGTIPDPVPHRRARALLHRARGVAATAAAGVPVTVATVSGGVGPALVSYAARAHLLVVGTHRLEGPVPLAGCRVLATVTAHARCPAVVVPRKWAGSWASTPSTRPVLVGVDGSAGGGRALAFAAETAQRLGVPLIPLTAGTDVAAGIERELVADRLAGCQEHYPGLAIEPLVTADDPVESLVDAARRAQLIVVSSRAPVAAPGPALGPTSRRLLRSSPCAVVVLSPYTAVKEPVGRLLDRVEERSDVVTGVCSR